MLDCVRLCGVYGPCQQNKTLRPSQPVIRIRFSVSLWSSVFVEKCSDTVQKQTTRYSQDENRAGGENRRNESRKVSLLSDIRHKLIRKFRTWKKRNLNEQPLLERLPSANHRMSKMSKCTACTLSCCWQCVFEASCSCLNAKYSCQNPVNRLTYISRCGSWTT